MGTSGRETRRADARGKEKRKEKMKMTRRILAALMALAMVFALAACGSGSTEEETGGEEVLSAEELQAQVQAIVDALTVPEDVDPAAVQGCEDGVLTIAMECVGLPDPGRAERHL